MIVKFFRFLAGYVHFTFKDGFIEGFLNDCYQSGLDIKNAKVKNGTLFGIANIETYKKLHSVALKNGGKVKIAKKVGIPFITYPIKNRWGIFAGFLFFIIFTSFMGGFVWNISIVGNDSLSNAKIIDYLAQNNFSVGTRWSSINKENLEMNVMSDFDDVSWISINKIGSSADIEINETIKKPNIKDNSGIYNVVAKKDGIIIDITALSGWNDKKSGEAVTKGDLLISGIYQSEVDKCNHYTHAFGTAMAKVDEKLEVNVLREQTKKIYKDTEDYKTLSFFGVKIPLYLYKNKGNYESKIEQKNCYINKKVLPIAIIDEKCSYFEEEKVTLTDEELIKMAENEYKEKEKSEFSNYKIIEKNINKDVNQNMCSIKGEYMCIEDIAEESKILIEKE